MMVAGLELTSTDLDALVFQHAAGLRAGVVELRRLSDDDGAGADDEHFFDRCILRHCKPFLSFSARLRAYRQKVSYNCAVFSGPADSAGRNCTENASNLVIRRRPLQVPSLALRKLILPTCAGMLSAATA